MWAYRRGLGLRIGRSRRRPRPRKAVFECGVGFAARRQSGLLFRSD